MSPEDLFLAWLIALPDRVDPSVAAREMLDALRKVEPSTPEQSRLQELLRQVTSFACVAQKRGDRRRFNRVSARPDLDGAAPL